MGMMLQKVSPLHPDRSTLHLNPIQPLQTPWALFFNS